MSERPLPLILNKNARGSRTISLMKWVNAHPGRFRCITSHTQEEARESIRRLVEEGEPLIVAAGGDGTLNMVAGELMGTGTTLGIIPSGTMNVFARELKLPIRNYEAAYKVLLGGKVSEVDVFTANDIPFLQMCGVGYDAQVVQRTTWGSKKKWGALAYFISGVRCLYEKPPILILRTPDGQVHEGVFAIMGNGSLYGGQFRLFPDASYEDGLLDILLFKKLGGEVIKQFLRGIFRSRKYPNPRNVLYLRLPSCEIESSQEVPFELDGDVKGGTPVKLKLSAQKLKVVTP